MNCKYCNTEFELTVTNKLFCSSKCRYRYNKYNNLNNLCLVCGTKTHNPKFCSSSCAATYNNSCYPKRELEGQCLDCGASISSSRKRCGNCNSIFNKTKAFSSTQSIRICTICKEEYIGNHLSKYCSRECKNSGRRKKVARFRIGYDISLKDAVYKYSHKSSAFSLIRARARSVVKYNGIPLICKNCGYSKHVEVCHIKPVSSFSEDTYLSIINSTDNLVVLCPNCHWEFDNGFLTIEQIKSN